MLSFTSLIFITGNTVAHLSHFQYLVHINIGAARFTVTLVYTRDEKTCTAGAREQMGGEAKLASSFTLDHH